jgi:CRP-like cAMP-binding protein
MAESFWHLKNCRLFEHVSASEIQYLESASRLRNVKRGEAVYLPSDSADSVFLLVGGRIKICQITSEGKQSILSFIEPGELFGELAILGTDQRGECAEAVANSQMVVIPKQELISLMLNKSEISAGISKIIGQRRQRIERRLRNLLFQSNRKRLIHLLLELVERYGVSTPNGVKINIKLTHLEMANVIGSTRETVTVVLGQLQDEGLIDVERRQITLCRLDRLAGEVDEKLPTLRRMEMRPLAEAVR